MAKRFPSHVASAFHHAGLLLGWAKRRSKLVPSSLASAAQVGTAAGAAWWAASALLPWEDPIYAPIAAVVAIGTGENRMVDRPFRLAAGMVVAVAVAGVVVQLAGTGVWQIILVTTITTVVGQFLFDDILARTYSAFHGAVIAALGASGVIPEQLIEASIGAVVGIAMVHLVLPPKVEPAVLSTVEKGGDQGRRALQGLARALRTGKPDEMERALYAARQVEASLAPADGSDIFGRQITRLAPARWRQRSIADRYIHADRHLRSVLLQAASAIRVAQPATVADPHPRPGMSAAVDDLDTALAWLVRPPFDNESREHIADAAERVRAYLSAVDISSDMDRLLYEELRELNGLLEGVAFELMDGGER